MQISQGHSVVMPVSLQGTTSCTRYRGFLGLLDLKRVERFMRVFRRLPGHTRCRLTGSHLAPYGG